MPRSLTRLDVVVVRGAVHVDGGAEGGGEGPGETQCRGGELAPEGRTGML